MDILITDSMLRDFLETKATPEKIAECLSLCGPSVEKITKEGKEIVYHIEVTTNRVDTASAYGIAREAATILPEFGIEAKLKEPKNNIKKLSEIKNKLKLPIKIDKGLCERFMAIEINDVNVKESPSYIKERLTAIGLRPINSAVDITNYVMVTRGIPLHAFDLDKLGKKIIVREAKRGEKFVTLDQKSHVANGGEIIFDNGKEIVDLPGIMGTLNSTTDKSTKNILLVAEHMDPLKIRQASLKHETRTDAAVINEKDPDPNEMPQGIIYALSLFTDILKAKPSSYFDWYPIERKSVELKITKEKIDLLLGISLKENQILKILKSLGFGAEWKDKRLIATPPTYRSKDVTIEEDLVEEIARVYGYFKLPSNLPTGALPTSSRETKYKFENRVKTLLSGWGGVEVYTYSMVSSQMVGDEAVKIKNPLGGEGEFMRTSLTPSLILAANDNRQEKDAFHIFEISNVYIPNGKKLPTEEMHLAGVFANTDYRHAKGILEALFEVLGVDSEVALTISGNYFTYEYSTAFLEKKSKEYKPFKEISKFPPQVEDMTVIVRGESKTADIIKTIKEVNTLISKVELKDMFEDNYTFTIYYQDPEKTLTDKEVSDIRGELVKAITSIGLSVK